MEAALVEPDYSSSQLAAAYHGLSEPQFTHGTELLKLLDVGSCHRILDVGCGTGRLAVAALAYLGDDAHVVGIDPAAPRIAVARQHRDPRLDFQIGRAEDLSPFHDASFDTVYFNSVLNWIGDRPRALGEAHRVLERGGRIGIATTVRDRPNQLHTLARLAWKAARLAGESGVKKGDGRSARNVSGGDVRSLILGAGFAPLRIEMRTFASLFRNVEQMVEFLLATTYGRLVQGGGTIDYAPFKAALEQLLLRDYPDARTAEGIRLERYVMLAIAEKPK